MSYSEDIEAINYYITYGPSNNTGIWPKTDAAKDIANEWRRFYENISIWDDSQKNYDLARNIRNRFQAANSITVEEKKVAENVAKTGMTTEEMQRKARRTTSSGQYLGPEVYTEPWISNETKSLLTIGGIIVLALTVLSKFSPLRFLVRK